MCSLRGQSASHMMIGRKRHRSPETILQEDNPGVPHDQLPKDRMTARARRDGLAAVVRCFVWFCYCYYYSLYDASFPSSDGFSLFQWVGATPVPRLRRQQQQEPRHPHHQPNHLQSESLLPHPRIVGGWSVPHGTYPWISRSAGTRWTCTGTLIHSDMILTAAHCQGVFQWGIWINAAAAGAATTSSSNTAAENHRNATTETLQSTAPPPLFRRVQRHCRHYGYDQNRSIIAHDIMLLQLDQPVPTDTTTTTTIEPIPLNRDPHIPQQPHQPLHVAGFGLLQFQGSRPDALQETILEYMDPERCQKWMEVFANVQFHEGLLCASSPLNQHSSAAVNGNNNHTTTGRGGRQSTSVCNGDSGGPLFITVPYPTTNPNDHFDDDGDDDDDDANNDNTTNIFDKGDHHETMESSIPPTTSPTNTTTTIPRNQPYYRHIQVGITSFGRRCRADTYPNGFTRVSYYYDWIQEQICRFSSDPPTACPVRFSPDHATTGTDETSSPHTMVVDRPVRIYLTFQHDIFPHQTTWAIRDVVNDRIVSNGPLGNPLEFHKSATRIDLPRPGLYQLEVHDTAGDGLVGTSPNGLFVGWWEMGQEPPGDSHHDSEEHGNLPPVLPTDAVEVAIEHIPSNLIPVMERTYGEFTTTMVTPFTVIDPTLPKLSNDDEDSTIQSPSGSSALPSVHPSTMYSNPEVRGSRTPTRSPNPSETPSWSLEPSGKDIPGSGPLDNPTSFIQSSDSPSDIPSYQQHSSSEPSLSPTGVPTVSSRLSQYPTITFYESAASSTMDSHTQTTDATTIFPSPSIPTDIVDAVAPTASFSPNSVTEQSDDNEESTDHGGGGGGSNRASGTTTPKTMNSERSRSDSTMLDGYKSIRFNGSSRVTLESKWDARTIASALFTIMMILPVV